MGGVVAILGVVAAPITTGDTALRSARLIVADMLKIDQSKLLRRLLVSVPVFVCTFALMMLDFDVLWRYFAWTNQMLAAFTLWAATVYLARHGRAFVVTMVPALFMTTVVTTYLFTAPSPEGFGLGFDKAIMVAFVADVACMAMFVRYRMIGVKSVGCE